LEAFLPLGVGGCATARVVDNRLLQLATLDVYSKGNSKLSKELNVDALPTVQFYYQGDVLTSFSCCPKEFYRLERAVEYSDVPNASSIPSMLLGDNEKNYVGISWIWREVRATTNCVRPGWGPPGDRDTTPQK
jgi:hypothetical protein